jgi:anti-sigma factor RsiW
MAACANHEFALAELVDGTLGEPESDALQRHLESCPRCRSWLAEYRAIDGRLGDALAKLMSAQDKLGQMREALRQTEPGDGAAALADWVCSQLPAS